MKMENIEERNRYKNRIKKQQNAIDNLLEISERHTRLFDTNIIKRLRERQEECARLYRKLDRNEFEIAIVGLEKAGKSTFANALMKNKILPDADERCTYTSTCIKYGSADRARVKFFSMADFDRKLRDNLLEMEIENVDQYSFDTLDLSEYKRIFSKLTPKQQTHYENNINRDIENLLENKETLCNLYLGHEDKIFEGDELRSKEFQSYITSNKVAVAVKEVTIESSKLETMKNAIIYDVPGFDSPTKMHAEQTEERMKKADAIILIASAEKPSLTGPALNMFTKVVDEDNVELSDKLFVFGNRADAANTLRKNIETLKNDAIRNNLLKIENLDSRLLIGSAKAYLQSINQEKGDFCVKRIHEGECEEVLPHGDGIEYTYEKLVEYNMKDRFRILKRKVNENDQEIQKIFKELKNECDNIDNSFTDVKKLIQESNRLCENSRIVIEGRLEELRGEIRDKYNSESVLSHKMQEEIKKMFSDGKYKITKNDINEAKRKVDGTTSSVNVEKVEEIIREKKFKEIYEEFSDTMLKIATEDHKKSYLNIVKVFENALSVNCNSSNYEKISEQIRAFIQEYKKEEENVDCYQALIERFVRDLVEILIMRPYGTEARLNRFLDDSSIFSGLIMFYDPGDNTSARGITSENNEPDYKRTFMAVAPKDQPLLYALLFHEYKNSISTSKSMFEYIASITKDIYNSSQALELICSIIKRNPVKAFDALKIGINKQDFVRSKRDDEKIISELIPKLRTVNKALLGDTKSIENQEQGEFDFTNAEQFIKQYKQHFGNLEKREYDNISSDFVIDLEILEDFLISASIPAICIEKPFVAKEVKAIDEILDKVRGAAFSDFVTGNIELLCKDSCDTYETKQNEKIVNRAVTKEIDKVLREMTEE